MITVCSRIKDKKINAVNIMVEIKIKDYLPIAKDIIKKNDLQRKRIKSSKTVYSLLRQDLKQGCTIPPIFLAIRVDELGNKSDINYYYNLNEEEIKKYFINKKLLILDGLQRTLQMIDLEVELLKNNDEEGLKEFINQTIRCETYVGINKVGILYRMLTLNTGQTPMSMRHQIEMIYKDYIGKTTIEGIELISEVDNSSVSTFGKYRFNEIIDGFESYLTRSELQLDKEKLLDDVSSLQKLSSIGQKGDVFKDFVIAYHVIIAKMINISNDWKYYKSEEDQEDNDKLEKPFGNDVESIFVKSQAITGFGAAVGVLEDMSLISSITELTKNVDEIVVGTLDIDEVYSQMLNKFDRIRQTAKKIGNSQRRYFYHFFKALLNKQMDSYLNIKLSIDAAEKMYNMEFA